MNAPILLGTHSWGYPAWLGGFFPAGTRSPEFLRIYAKAFDSVEVDATFYGTPPAATVQGWFDRTPDHFVFALKFPQTVTHEQRLRDPEGLTEQFFDRVRLLGHKLGPVLVQLGPDFGPAEWPALTAFIDRLPSDLRIAIEFRQRGWITESLWTLLHERNIALALVDGPWIPRRWTFRLAERPTADFAYIRWMGPDRAITDHSHVQVDRTKELTEWRETLTVLRTQVSVVYGYMSNYYEGHAPASVRTLQQFFGLQAVDPALLTDQLPLL